MRFLRFILPYRTAIALLVFAAGLALLWRWIPAMDRPVETLAAGVVVLGVLAAGLAAGNLAHNALVMAATLAAVAFMAEICQKYTNFLNLAEVSPNRAAVDGAGSRPRLVAAGDSGRAFLFLGGAAAYGAGLADGDTLPAAFADAGGRRDRVVNLARPDAGPNVTAREIETDQPPLAADLGGAKVEGVYYLLTDELPGLAENPDDRSAPRYALRDGKAVHRGPFREPGDASRLSRLLDRGRIYPWLRERIAAGFGPFAAEYKWELTCALLSDIDRLCRERFSVPLTVVYWGGRADVGLRLKLAGIRFVPAVPDPGAARRADAAPPDPATTAPPAGTNRELGARLYRDDAAGFE